MTSSCRPQTIHESATVDIQYCPDCQMLHLTMGSITIRMNEHHFSQFAKDIGRGLFAFHSAGTGRAGMHMIM